MFEPQHCLSSEEKIIDDKLMELRAGNSRSPSTTYIPNLPTQSGERVGNANHWKQKVKIFAVKIMNVRRRSVTDLIFVLATS